MEASETLNLAIIGSGVMDPLLSIFEAASTETNRGHFQLLEGVTAALDFATYNRLDMIDKFLTSTIPIENHSLLQLCVILYRKIMWNTAFNEISTLEGDLYRQLREFMEKRTEYMRKVNELLDSILSGERELDFFQYKGVEDKYIGVEEELKDFKVKLARAIQYVEKGRIEWLDGFLVNQLRFVILSEQERKVIVNRSKEGDRVTAEARSLLNELMGDWIRTDLETRFKDCVRRVENLLRGRKQTGASSTFNASKRKAAKALRKRALRTIRKKTVSFRFRAAKLHSSSQK